MTDETNDVLFPPGAAITGDETDPEELHVQWDRFDEIFLEAAQKAASLEFSSHAPPAAKPYVPDPVRFPETATEIPNDGYLPRPYDAARELRPSRSAGCFPGMNLRSATTPVGKRWWVTCRICGNSEQVCACESPDLHDPDDDPIPCGCCGAGHHHTELALSLDGSWGPVCEECRERLDEAWRNRDLDIH